jgi:hypothetical protein
MLDARVGGLGQGRPAPTRMIFCFADPQHTNQHSLDQGQQSDESQHRDAYSICPNKPVREMRTTIVQR